MNNFSVAGIIIAVVIIVVGIFLITPYLIMVLLGGLSHSLGYPQLAVGFGSSVQLTLLLCIFGGFTKTYTKKSS